MGCVALQTGKDFLATALNHLDCQGQTLGAYGYSGLADPASPASLALTAMLTIFIALFGLRLLLGQRASGEDLIGSIIRIGIVLTLATAWPAWRVIGYNLVLDGPAEIAQSIGIASALPTGPTLVSRLQNADDGMVAITMYGSGRLTGGIVGGSDLGDSLHGVAIPDQTGFGWGRVAFLVGVIGPWAMARIGAGLLLALAPLMAGLLLFTGTTGLFLGWVRGLAFVAMASLGISIAAAVAITLIDPWASDVLAARGSNIFTPAAPTELMVLGLAAFALNFGILGLAARIAFFPHAVFRQFVAEGTAFSRPTNGATLVRGGRQWGAAMTLPRAQAIADSVAITMHREEASTVNPREVRPAAATGGRELLSAASSSQQSRSPDPLGSTFRRNHRRMSATADRRDTRL